MGAYVPPAPASVPCFYETLKVSLKSKGPTPLQKFPLSFSGFEMLMLSSVVKPLNSLDRSLLVCISNMMKTAFHREVAEAACVKGLDQCFSNFTLYMNH